MRKWKSMQKVKEGEKKVDLNGDDNIVITQRAANTSVCGETIARKVEKHCHPPSLSFPPSLSLTFSLFLLQELACPICQVSHIFAQDCSLMLFSTSEQKGVKPAAGDVMQCFGASCKSLIMFGFLSCRPNKANLDRSGKLEGPTFSFRRVWYVWLGRGLALLIMLGSLRTTRTKSKRHLTRVSALYEKKLSLVIAVC